MDAVALPERNRYKKQRRQLDPQQLLTEARVAAGLSDFGGVRFIEPMTRLLDRAAREVDFSNEGLAGFKTDAIRYLVNRLRTQQAIQQHPEILLEDVSDPVVVIGLPRSGTTKMQRMLAAAPDAQKLYLWRLLNPAPFPNALAGKPDPRIAAIAMPGDLLASDNESLQAAHEMAAGVVDEETILFDFTWDSSVNGFNTYLPLFFHEAWVDGKDSEADREAYRFVRTLLQYLQWQDGGRGGKFGNRPWVLKTTFHLAHLDTLLECFPKATLVHCHRDPQTSMPSIAKLMCAVWGAKANVDARLVGEGLLLWASAATKRYLDARQRLQLDGRIVDAKYEDIRDNALPIIREIYRRSGRQLTPEAEQSMQQWEKSSEQDQHGKHRYSLEEFGWTKAAIDQAFPEYIPRFIDR